MRFFCSDQQVNRIPRPLQNLSEKQNMAEQSFHFKALLSSHQLSAVERSVVVLTNSTRRMGEQGARIHVLAFSCLVGHNANSNKKSRRNFKGNFLSVSTEVIALAFDGSSENSSMELAVI